MISRASIETEPKVESAAGKTSWLSALRVGCLGNSLPLRIAGQVLAQFGADVVDVASDRGDAEREALSRWDIVLADRIENPISVPGLADSAAAYREFVQNHNRSVWVTASAFGLDGEWADGLASEVTLLAASGILGHSRFDGDWAPTIPAGSIALKLVGNIMAVVALHSLHEHRRTGQPVHADLSAQSAVIATGLCLETAHALSDCPDEGGSARYGAPTGFFECIDGFVYVLVLEQHQWVNFRDVLAPALESVLTLEDARARTAEVNTAMKDWTATRRTADCEQALQAAGIPCTTVNTVEDFIRRAQAAGRPLALTGQNAVKLPAVVSETGPKAPDPRCVQAMPLGDLRVLDAGHVLAVPLAAAWLGAMGAQVTKVEDPARLDLYRRRGPFAAGIPGLNRSAYFNQINFCKTPLDITVDATGSSLDVTPFDVVIHNLSPQRARKVGVDSAAVAAAPTAKLQICSSGFGQTGELADYRAYGTNIHAFAGLVASTRNARGQLAGVGTPWADPLASVAIAAWVLAWSLAPERVSSVSVDISMGEILAAHLVELIGHWPEETYAPSRDGAEFVVRLPQSGRLLAVTLIDTVDVAAFESIIGSSLPRRRRRGELLDVSLGSLATLADEDVLRRLRQADLRVCIVYTASDLASKPWLSTNGLFQTVQSGALGDYRVTGLPWRFVGRPTTPLTAAPERPESDCA